MTRFILTADGANIGLPPLSFTSEDQEHLAIFVQIFRVRLTNSEVKAFIITKSPDFNAWQPTQHHVIKLARLHIKELIRDGKISLKASGLNLGRPAPDDSTPHPELAQHYYKQGYEVQEKTRGQQDHMAYNLMRQQGRLALTRSWSTASVAPMSTFGVGIPDIFAPLCPVSKELIKIFKVVIMGLGGTELKPTEIVVYTTLPDTDEWPFANAKALDLVQNFITDQIYHNRVSLCCRPEGKSFCTPSQLCTQDNGGVGGGVQSFISNVFRLPETFVDLVCCIFDQASVGENHIVDIARMSMKLAGNQSLLHDGFIQPRLLVPLPNTSATYIHHDGTSQTMMAPYNNETPPPAHDSPSAMVIVPNDQIPDFLRREVSGTSDKRDNDEADDASSKTQSSRTMSALEEDKVAQSDADLLGPTF